VHGVKPARQGHAPHVPHGQDKERQGKGHGPEYDPLFLLKPRGDPCLFVSNILLLRDVRGETCVVDGLAKGALRDKGRVKDETAAFRAQIDAGLYHTLHAARDALDARRAGRAMHPAYLKLQHALPCRRFNGKSQLPHLLQDLVQGRVLRIKAQIHLFGCQIDGDFLHSRHAPDHFFDAGRAGRAVHSADR
jgi:hypothetical protein